MQTVDLAAQISDDELDAAVNHLRQFYKQFSIAFAVAIGQYTVDTFYAGDFNAARSKNPASHAKFNELLQRRGPQLLDMDLPARTLKRYIAATEVWNDLPAHTRAQLRVTHLDLLAGVAKSEERLRLAHDAATMHWSGEQTALAVADYKKRLRHGKKKTGPKHKPAVLKAVVALHRAAKHLHHLHGAALSLAEPHSAAFAFELEGVRKLLADLG